MTPSAACPLLDRDALPDVPHGEDRHGRGEVVPTCEHVQALAADLQQIADLGCAHEVVHAAQPRCDDLLTGVIPLGEVRPEQTSTQPARCVNTERAT